MDDLNLLLKYATRLLIWLAPLEFLLGRAISRASRQMPAGELGAAIFSAISGVGTFLVMPAFLLVLVVLAATAGLALRAGRGPALATAGAPGLAWSRPLAGLLLLFLALSIALLLPGVPPLALLVYNLVSAALVLAIAFTFAGWARAGLAVRASLALLGLAYAGYYVYASAAILAQAADVPVGDAGVLANALGEAAAMAAGISLLASAGLFRRAPGGWRRRLPWAIPAGLATLVVLVAAHFEQWLQGVATQFSVGFTLFLPVPVSALALGAWVYATLAMCSRHAAVATGLPWAWDFGAGLLLLPAAGYQLQLNYQHLLLVAALLLLSGLLRPLSGGVLAVREPAPADGGQHAPPAGSPGARLAGAQEEAPR